ncbi:ATP-binding protein [Streptomyces sp. NPDC048441]|uniref:ATP-binding protein n=1 Tax=Streptomyces sp. NPDC048441 TaxID=3365552 RepID=UPI00371536C4
MNPEITQTPLPVGHFTILLSATPRGARLGRRLAVQQLTDWGWRTQLPAAEHVIAELANNAATHGRVPGRSFRLELTLTDVGTLRIEVTDTRGAAAMPPVAQFPSPEAESGRGLLLVEALSARWGTELGPSPHKTVWAELDRC